MYKGALYTIAICIDGIITDMCPRLLFVCYVSGWTYFIYDMHLCGNYVLPDILAYILAIQIYSFCVTVSCLSDDLMSLFVIVIDLLLLLCLFV